MLKTFIELETGLDPSPITSTAQQPNPRCSLSTSQHSIQSIEKDGLSSPRLTRKHCETSAELELKLVDQSDVLQLQTGEHNRTGDESERSGDTVRLEGGAQRPRQP